MYRHICSIVFLLSVIFVLQGNCNDAYKHVVFKNETDSKEPSFQTEVKPDADKPKDDAQPTTVNSNDSEGSKDKDGSNKDKNGDVTKIKNRRKNHKKSKKNLRHETDKHQKHRTNYTEPSVWDTIKHAGAFDRKHPNTEDANSSADNKLNANSTQTNSTVSSDQVVKENVQNATQPDVANVTTSNNSN